MTALLAVFGVAKKHIDTSWCPSENRRMRISDDM